MRQHFFRGKKKTQLQKYKHKQILCTSRGVRGTIPRAQQAMAGEQEEKFWCCVLVPHWWVPPSAAWVGYKGGRIRQDVHMYLWGFRKRHFGSFGGFKNGRHSLKWAIWAKAAGIFLFVCFWFWFFLSSFAIDLCSVHLKSPKGWRYWGELLMNSWMPQSWPFFLFPPSVGSRKSWSKR